MNENACSMMGSCKNQGVRCDDCLAFWETDEAVLDMELPLRYVAPRGSGLVHPLTRAKKLRKKHKQQQAAALRRRPEIKARRQQTMNALKVEGKTRTEFTKATHRSGATAGDGDTRLVGKDGEELSIGIDDKFHSRTTKTLTLSTSEIDKAQRQNCIIVVTLANGRKFVAADFAYLLRFAEEISQITKP